MCNNVPQWRVFEVFSVVIMRFARSVYVIEHALLHFAKQNRYHISCIIYYCSNAMRSYLLNNVSETVLEI